MTPAPFETDANRPPVQYGVSNPHWFDKEYPSSTENYGPNDFVVETVNLDKNFFYQFFTSKPMIIDTDVVTSKSVQVNYVDKNNNKGLKRGRETLSNLPEHLVGNDILPEHILRKKMGEIQETIKKLVAEQEKDEKEGGEEEEEEEHNSDLQLVNNKNVFVVTGIPNLETKLKFRRYQLPPEVRITSKVSMPKYEKRQSKANTPERAKEVVEGNEHENEVNDEHVFQMEEEALIM